jgi:hypothetical protein
MLCVHVDRDGELDIDTLWYRVEVEGANGWVELVEARWPTLGVSEESACEEANWTVMQDGIGIPVDASETHGPVFLTGRR